MKNILFLVSENGERSKSLVEGLNKELGSIKVFVHELSEVSMEINQSGVSVKVGTKKITDYDLVYFRKTKGRGKNYVSLAATVACFLDSKSIAYFDSLYGKAVIGDKLIAITKLALSGVPVIPTLYYSLEGGKNAYSHVVDSLGLPFIVKHLYLQKLQGVYIVKKEEDFKKIMAMKFDAYLFQKFVDIKEEFRLLVLGNEVGVIHTKVKRSYKSLEVGYENMTAYGEYLDTSSFSKELKDIAVKSAKTLNLEVAGVDIVVDTSGNFWVIEVNRGPALYEHADDYPAIKAVAEFLKKQVG